MTTQFEGIKDAKERAAVFFRRDRRKWYNAYNWLCGPGDKKGKMAQDFTVERLQRSGVSERKREIFREFGPALARLLGIDLQTLEEDLNVMDGDYDIFFSFQ